MVEYWNNGRENLDETTKKISFFIFEPIIPLFQCSIIPFKSSLPSSLLSQSFRDWEDNSVQISSEEQEYQTL